MGYRLVESSSDVVIEAEGPDLEAALLGLAAGFAHITTAGTPIRATEQRGIRAKASGDLAALAVAFVDELIFLFGTEGFLPAGGALRVASRGGTHQVEGELRGERFDPARHALGTEVKAATWHEAVLEGRGGRARARVLVDL